MNKEREAFNTALRTLQQRCEYLQRRLAAVEEENSKLKQEKSQEGNNKVNKTSLDNLEKQVVLLNQQKLQMSHQIQIITKENQALWSQLTKLLPGFENEKLSVSPLKEEFKSSNCNSLELSNSMLGDYGRESLEEISLKLINSILIGKTQLENQYSEMIDLQKDTNPVEDKPTVYLPPQFDSESKLKSMKIYMQKLKDFKQALNKQKNDLSNVIIALKNQKYIPVRKVSINSSQMLAPESVHFNGGGSDSNELQPPDPIPFDNTNKDEDFDTLKICPMCGENYTGKFTDFYHHVSSHFQEDDDEFVDASATFEVVP